MLYLRNIIYGYIVPFFHGITDSSLDCRLHVLICRFEGRDRVIRKVFQISMKREGGEKANQISSSRDRINDRGEKHATKREHKDRGRPGHSRVKSERRSCAAGRNADDRRSTMIDGSSRYVLPSRTNRAT